VYSSKRFKDYLLTVHGITVTEGDYLPQFADGLFDSLPAAPVNDALNLVFAGNIGKVQGVETLIRAAALLRNEPIRWHILGDGANLPTCEALVSELSLSDTVTLYGRRPLADMPAFYAMADAMLVSMRNDISVNDTLPGKVQSYMAAGKPILGSIAGETPLIVAEAGGGVCRGGARVYAQRKPRSHGRERSSVLRAALHQTGAYGQAGGNAAFACGRPS